MVALGLIPEGTDLFGTTLEEQASGIVGYYDPDTKEMVLISDSGGSDALAQITYAHEFVHALQDQHFDLNSLQDQVDALNDSEASSAFRALVEGDATVAQFQFMLRHPDLVAAMDFGDSGASSAPPVITESMLFPYLAGSAFVTKLLREGSGRRSTSPTTTCRSALSRSCTLTATLRVTIRRMYRFQMSGAPSDQPGASPTRISSASSWSC